MKASSIIKGTFISIALFLITLYLFIRSPYLKDSIEWLIHRYGGMDIKIGSLSISRRTIAEDVVIKRSDSPVSLLKIKQMRLVLGLSGLMNRTIEGIEFIEPEIHLDLTAGGGRGDKGEPFFNVNRMVIQDGSMSIKTTAGTYHLSSINLTIEESSSGGAGIRGRVYIGELDAEVPLDMVVDLKDMTLRSGSIEMTLKQIRRFTGGGIDGDIDLVIEISRGQGMMVVMTAQYHDIKLIAGGRTLNAGSGGLNITITPSPDYKNMIFRIGGGGIQHIINEHYQLTMKGSYDIVEDRLDIDGLVKTARYGRLIFSGYLNGMRSEGLGIDLVLRTEGLDLKNIEHFSPITDTMDGYLHSVISVKGAIGSPVIKGNIYLDRGAIRNKGLEIKGLNIKAGFLYKDHNIDINDTYIRVDKARFNKDGVQYLTEDGMEIYPVFKVILSDRYIKGTIRMNILNAGLLTPDDSMAVEGLRLRAVMDIESLYPFEEIGFKITSLATGFEVLLGTFYGDFTDRDISLSIKGRYLRKDALLNIKEARIVLPHIGVLYLAGDISGLGISPSINTKLKLSILDNEQAYNLFIRDTFGETFPILSKLDVNGRAFLLVSLKRSGEVTEINGKMNLEDMDIEGEGISIEDINLTLPVNISEPLIKVAEGPSYGLLKIGNMNIRGIEVKDVLTYPTIYQNDLILKDNIKVTLFGGDIIVKEFKYRNIISEDRELSLSMEIKDMDLGDLTNKLNIQEFGGSITGSIPMIRLSHNNLFTDGEVMVHAFGGDVRISNLSISNVFSRIPSISTSIKLNDIDLGMLTDTFEFGKITGIMNGYVRNLVITSGEVERFDISLETVKRKGVGQWISVKALKKISILGSGGTTSILDRGIYRLFKKYRYEKMGFRGSLRNDRMRLHGIMREGSKEYIVKGGFLPPRVDVVSYTQDIAFKELVRRLKRIKGANID